MLQLPNTPNFPVPCKAWPLSLTAINPRPMTMSIINELTMTPLLISPPSFHAFHQQINQSLSQKSWCHPSLSPTPHPSLSCLLIFPYTPKWFPYLPSCLSLESILPQWLPVCSFQTVNPSVLFPCSECSECFLGWRPTTTLLSRAKSLLHHWAPGSISGHSSQIISFPSHTQPCQCTRVF
jgi:hypothetical protein